MKQIALSALLYLAACNVMPPAVSSRSHVRHLSSATLSVRARGLPREDFDALRRLQVLERLDFGGGWAVLDCPVDDAGLIELSELGLDELTDLSLGWCPCISEVGLASVGRFPSLTYLFLPGCENVGDAALPAIAAAPQIRYLDLRGCPRITDAGVLQLAGRRDWDRIVLDGCASVTEEGVNELRALLPFARIDKDDEEWWWMTHPHERSAPPAAVAQSSDWTRAAAADEAEPSD